MAVVDISNTRPDYSYLGLTWSDGTTAVGADEYGNGALAGVDPGYVNGSGIRFTADQADAMASAANRLRYPNITNPDMYVDYASLQNDPANVVGALTRAQWEDYKLRFQPMEEQLMNMTSYKDPSVVAAEVNRATAGSIKAAQLTQGVTGRNMARYGLSMNTVQQAAQDRSNQLATSTAAVDAANRARFGITDRNRAIAVGASPNAGRSYGLRSEALAE